MRASASSAVVISSAARAMSGAIGPAAASLSSALAVKWARMRSTGSMPAILSVRPFDHVAKPFDARSVEPVEQHDVEAAKRRSREPREVLAGGGRHPRPLGG